MVSPVELIINKSDITLSSNYQELVDIQLERAKTKRSTQADFPK